MRRRRAHELFGFGVGRWRHITGQVMREAAQTLSRNPGAAGRWLKMFNRNCKIGYSDTLSKYE
jgi:hypothetical protein